MNSPLYTWYKRKVARVAAMIILGFAAVSALGRFTFGRGGEQDSLSYIITVRHFGTDPGEIERTITIPLESELAALPGIVEIRSTSQLNTSRITLHIDRKTDAPVFFLLLREAVERVYTGFPDSVQRPEIYSSAGGSHPIMVIAFQAPADYIEDEIKPLLTRVPGIGEVISGGSEVVELHISTDTSRLHQTGLSLSRLAEKVRSSRGNMETGFLEIDGIEKPVQIQGRIRNPDELSSLPLNLPGGNIVPLSRLASLEVKARKKDAISRMNGKLCTILYIRDSGLRSPLEISRIVRANLIAAAETGYDIIHDFGRTLENSIREAAAAILISMILSALVLAAFFRRGSISLILALFIPFNVVLTLGLTSLFGLPVDTPLLAGLAVGIGVICDGGIIITHAMYMDKKINGIHHIFPSVVSGSVTTIISAVPLLFLPRDSGSVKQMAITFSTLISVSTCTALFFLPPLLNFRNRYRNEYLPMTIQLLWKVLQLQKYHPGFPLLLAGILTAAGVSSLTLLPRSVAPFIDDPVVYGYLECRRGAGNEFVDRELEELSSHLTRLPGIEKVETLARRNRGTFSVHFNTKTTSRDRVVEALNKTQAFLAGSFIHISSKNSNLYTVRIDFIGPVYEYLKQTAVKSAGLLQPLPWVANTVLHFSDGDPSWTFKPNRQKMAAAALSFRYIAGSLRWGLFGPVVFKWIDLDRERDVRVMGKRDLFESIEEMKQGGVIDRNSRFVSLASLGTFQRGTEEETVYRLNRQRCVSISIQTPLTSLSDLRRKLEEVLSSLPVKAGYGVRIDPALNQLASNYAALRFSLIIAFLLVYMVLAGQYESFTAPVIIFLSIPLSLSFPLMGLLFTDSLLTSASLIGMVMVTGLSVNNTILVVDDVLRRREHSPDTAVEKAVFSALRKRISPLLITTVTTLIGLIPLFFYQGHNSAMIRQLSYTVFSGIAGSAIVSIMILPGLLIRFPHLTRRFTVPAG